MSRYSANGITNRLSLSTQDYGKPFDGIHPPKQPMSIYSRLYKSVLRRPLELGSGPGVGVAHETRTFSCSRILFTQKNAFCCLSNSLLDLAVLILNLLLHCFRRNIEPLSKGLWTDNGEIGARPTCTYIYIIISDIRVHRCKNYVVCFYAFCAFCGFTS